MNKSVSDFNGINTYTNPFNTPDGNIIHCVNLESSTNGSRIKRSGYAALLGTANGSAINSLFSWTKNDGTTLFLYRASGNILYHSLQGTGAWTISGNGTITAGAHVGYAVLNNTLVVGDGAGSVRYSTNGTSFTDATASVASEFLEEYQGRIYAAGTASDVFYSTTGTASDWTTDSSSILIGGAGKLGKIFKGSDRLITTKNSGLMHRWDGDSLVDMATKLGPSSPYSVAEIEDYRIYLNRLGIFITNASKPQLISNPIQRQIYNKNGTGVGAATFNTAPAVAHEYDYLVAVGSVRDDYTDIPINNAIIGYDYKHNEFVNYQYTHFPTALHSYKDANNVQRLIFGNSVGQVYQFDDTYTDDAGQPIEASMVITLHGDMPHIRKDFGHIEFFTSPGCQAKVQFAVEDVIKTSTETQYSGARIWKDLCSLAKGYTLVRFPPETRGRLLYLRVYEASENRPWEFYSINYTFEPIPL